MATTPLIKTPQVDGGTFYTFSSGARDLTRTLGNENLRLVFSKFVLLNIPDFIKLDISLENFPNYMQFDTIDGMILNGGLKADPNVNLTESLQNYALNLEELILSNNNYDNNQRRSVTERVFFKWLKETGAIRFREATDQEKTSNIDIAFVEEDERLTGENPYRRVVKYIGDIDIVNNVNRAGEAYTELYIHVPTEVGGTPTVLFNAIEDNNYKPGLIVRGDSEFIKGRNTNTIHPQGLSINAFYDYDDQVIYINTDANWISPIDNNIPPVLNAYYTEPVTFIDPTNSDITKSPIDFNNPPNFAGVRYRRSRLDGISLDFNPSHYQQIARNPEISTIQQFNGIDLASTFEFNSVLVYYDLVDLSDPEKTVTNLYGLLLLDNVTPTANGGFIQRYPKFKPNRITGQNGNSFGFKVNLRFDASPGTAGVSTIINDYNTFSMGLFVDAIAQLQESSRIFQRQQLELRRLLNRVEGIENNLNSISTVVSLQDQIDSLNERFNNASISLSSSSTLLDLIAKNSDDIQSIINGRVSTSLQYNSDAFRAGPGIRLNKETPNQVRIDLNDQKYNFMIPFDENTLEITIDNALDLNTVKPMVITSLQPFTNMLRLYTKNEAAGDLLIYIDDSSTQWKRGQVVKLTFNNNLNIGTRRIRVFTDSLNRLNQGVYGVEIATISNEKISEKPIIELICTEQGILEFVHDVIK